MLEPVVLELVVSEPVVPDDDEDDVVVVDVEADEPASDAALALPSPPPPPQPPNSAAIASATNKFTFLFIFRSRLVGEERRAMYRKPTECDLSQGGDVANRRRGKRLRPSQFRPRH